MDKKRQRSIDPECTSNNKVILDQRKSRETTDIAMTEATFKVSQLVQTALRIGEAHGVVRNGKSYLVRDVERCETPYPQHLTHDTDRRC